MISKAKGGHLLTICIRNFDLLYYEDRSLGKVKFLRYEKPAMLPDMKFLLYFHNACFLFSDMHTFGANKPLNPRIMYKKAPLQELFLFNHLLACFAFY